MSLVTLARGVMCAALLGLLLLSLWHVMPVAAVSRAYQGSVTINGSPAVDGTEVTVFVEGKTSFCASTRTVNGRYTIAISDTGGDCPHPGTTPTLTFFVNHLQVGSLAYVASEGTEIVDLVVNQAGEVLSGRAVIGGRPAARAMITVFVQGNSTACTTGVTGEDGRFEIVVPPQSPATAACPTPGQTLTFRIDGAAAAPTLPFEPARRRTVDLTAVPVGHTITGTALAGGQPAADAPVEAFIDRTTCGQAMTDAQGRFSLIVLSAHQQPDCGVNGALITFTVGGQRATQSLEFQMSGITTGLSLTVVALQCQFSNLLPLDGSSTSESRPVISAAITCQTPPSVTTMALDGIAVTPTITVSGIVQSITYQPPEPLAVGQHTVTLAVAADGRTSWSFSVSEPPAIGMWLDRPPANPGAVRVCPPAGQWRLFYWSGPPEAPISVAAEVCPEATIFWIYRQGRWLGYAKLSPQASDFWYSLHGEAHFLRGR